MANESQVKELESACAAIEELSPKKEMFIRRSEWGEITFESAKKDIETVFWIVKEIVGLPIHILPESVISSSTTRLREIKNTFEGIDAFSIVQGDASSLRDSLTNNLRQEVQNLMSEIGIWLPVLALRAGEIQNWVSQTRETSTQASQILQEIKTYETTQRNEIDKAVEAARAAAGEAGAAEFTHEFRKEVDTVEKRSKQWLWPTGVFSAFALALSVLLMLGLLGAAPTDTWEAVYKLGGRVIAISVLFYAAVWSGRVVLANMHLASVNKHRAVSLQTLQAFHEAAEDPAAKDAVVIEAARAVYENVPSGYIGRQVTGQGTGARTLEVVRGADRAPRAGDDG